MIEDERKFTDLPKMDLKKYTCGISPNTYNRIDRVIYLIKRLDDREQTKQRWIVQAIKEKLDSEKETGSPEFYKEKRVNFKIEKKLIEQLEKKIEVIKRFRRSFSKKQWILEAIYDKLDKDEEKAEKLLAQISSSN